MKQIIREWLLPPKINEFISSQISIYKTKRMGIEVIKKNKELKDKYKGQRCFILGNAPTIKDIDITLFKDEYVFVMSTFYNHPDFNKLNNVFHTNVHLTGSNNDVKNLKWLKSIDAYSPNVKKFFFGLKEKRLIEENNLFRNKQVYYIATANIKRNFDISKITKNYQTNVLQALEIAMYMGFEYIYMHSININSICSNKYDYFFDRSKLPYEDPAVESSNGIKDYFLQVNSFYKTIRELDIVNIYSKSHNYNIYYTNKESLLKLFKYMDLEYILKK